MMNRSRALDETPALARLSGHFRPESRTSAGVLLNFSWRTTRNEVSPEFFYNESEL
jgi:hypothetical protein